MEGVGIFGELDKYMYVQRGGLVDFPHDLACAKT